jgi:lipooligosaccharide transport system permease protein
VPAATVSERAGRRTRVDHVRPFDPGALIGVVTRDVTLFSRSWLSFTITAVLEPTIYLVGLGLGIGELVGRVRGVDYIEFLGTGTIVTAVVFSSAIPAMFQTFVKRRFQRAYDALLAAPINVAEIVAGEILWLSTRAGVYGLAPLLVTIAFGLDLSWGMLLVPPIGFVTAVGFAAFGITMSAMAKSLDRFNNISSAVLTPLVILGGVFFPLERLPDWVETLAWINPLYHAVELMRHAVFGLEWVDFAHLGILVAFAVIMWTLAVNRLRPALVD